MKVTCSCRPSRSRTAHRSSTAKAQGWFPDEGPVRYFSFLPKRRVGAFLQSQPLFPAEIPVPCSAATLRATSPAETSSCCKKVEFLNPLKKSSRRGAAGPAVACCKPAFSVRSSACIDLPSGWVCCFHYLEKRTKKIWRLKIESMDKAMRLIHYFMILFSWTNKPSPKNRGIELVECEANYTKTLCSNQKLGQVHVAERLRENPTQLQKRRSHVWLCPYFSFGTLTGVILKRCTVLSIGSVGKLRFLAIFDFSGFCFFIKKKCDGLNYSMQHSPGYILRTLSRTQPEPSRVGFLSKMNLDGTLY